MPKKLPSPAEMKRAVEEFKKQFTGGFYHGSPSNKIKAFDSAKNKDPMKLETPGVTFVTRDPDFAESFLPMTERGQYASGATMYPVKVKLGKHWNPSQPESQQVVEDYLAKMYPHEVNPDDLVDIKKQMLKGNWIDIENPNFLQHLRDTGHDTFHIEEGGVSNVGVLKPQNIRGKFAKYNPEDADSPDFMKAEGGAVEGYAPGGKVGALAKFARHPHGQDPNVAKALEEYLKGNISQEERIRIMNQYLPMRQWKELPPTYTDDEIRNALTSDKQPKALAPVPAGIQVGNRLDIPAYTRHGVYVDTTHDINNKNKSISYNRTGHLKDVEFSSKPNQAVRVGLGTQEQALTPMGEKIGSAKSPFALIKGTNVGTSDEEVRRMMEEMLQDPRYTQIGMDPRRHSQFYDKETGLPVWAAEEKLQSGPLILAPKQGLDTTSWDDPRLNLSDFEGKKYAPGGAVKKALEHARKINFVHFSNKPDLTHLDPNMYGTGIKGQEAARLKSAPDIRPRSYIYTDRPDVRPEQGLGSHKYSGVAEDMYPLHEDPAGYSAIAKTKAIDPYMMSMGREVIDQPTHLNELERLIKAAGYKGYANDDVGLLFHPTEVKKVSGPEHFATGGSVQHYDLGGPVISAAGFPAPQIPGMAGTLVTTETPVGLLPSNLNDFATGGGKFDPKTGLPSNYQEARNAFDQQQEAERAKNPFGNVSATVVGNDQFGQQFGYAADADAFNQFYNKNYSATTPVDPVATPNPNGSWAAGVAANRAANPLVQPMTPETPMTQNPNGSWSPTVNPTGPVNYSNSNTGGLSGLLFGNKPAVTTTIPTYKPAAPLNNLAANVSKPIQNSIPSSTVAAATSSPVTAKQNLSQLSPSSPVAAATLPPPKVDFRNAMKPVAMAANPVRQNPIVKPMFSRTNFFKKR